MAKIWIKVYPQHPHVRAINKAVDILKNDGVIIYPTDTIYGLGASIKSKKAIERIYNIKKISNHKLLSFICSDFQNVSQYAYISNIAFKIMKRCLPGPFTFILPATRLVPKILFQKRPTVGVRIPDSILCQTLVKELGLPIISTSVPAGADEILNDPLEIDKRYSSKIDLLLENGILVSEPSTIVDLTTEDPVIIRKGKGDISLLY
jgi:tRNA threonylcarbamoyl adenosine modification protein (Sua5/YciO/YrdC/YwlC family)